jgi:hypothetical protein
VRVSTQVADSEGHEALVVLAEVRDEALSGGGAAAFEPIVGAVTAAISAEHGISVTRLCLLKQKTVPKTTSGKIARKWCSKAFHDGSLSIIHDWSDSSGGESSPFWNLCSRMGLCAQHDGCVN